MKTKYLTIYSDSSDTENNKNIKEKDYIELNFEKNKYSNNSNFIILKNYVKKNKNQIIELLLKKIIKIKIFH